MFGLQVHEVGESTEIVGQGACEEVAFQSPKGREKPGMVAGARKHQQREGGEENNGSFIFQCTRFHVIHHILLCS